MGRFIGSCFVVGESSGKASKSVAKHIPGPCTLDPLRAQTSTAGSEVMKARIALQERGEKLSEVEDRTAMMAEGAKAYSEHTSELVSKFKNKKWYQI